MKFLSLIDSSQKSGRRLDNILMEVGTPTADVTTSFADRPTNPVIQSTPDLELAPSIEYHSAGSPKLREANDLYAQV